MPSQIDLKRIAEYDEGDISKATEEINETTYILKKNLRKKIRMYEELMGTEMQNYAFENITEVFEKIDNSLGFKIYMGLHDLSLINNGKVISGIDEVFKFIDQFPSAAVQWPVIAGFYLFDHETEKKLINPGTYTINQEQFFGNLKFYSATDDITMQQLMNPDYSTRRHDHWKLFLNLVVAECIGLEPIYEYYDLKDPSKKLATQKGFLIQKNGTEIDIRVEIRKLFKMVFDTTKKEVQVHNEKNKNFPAGKGSLDPSNPIWNKLGEAANKLTSSVKSLKNEFPIIIANIKKDQINFTFQEIRDFLNSVSEFDEKVIPARSKIESIAGGQGLVKKMSKAGGPGGIEKIKEDYPKWIFEQLRLEEKAKANKDIALEKDELGEGKPPRTEEEKIIIQNNSK
tara:strand:- start:159 stop:1355 length:1197 start_codon:yes stop_codon:yes gene_type:complete